MRGVYRSRKLWVWAIVLVLLTGPAVLGQKRAITPEDYDQWESLGGGSLSPDGEWAAYQISKVEGDGTLYIKGLVTDKEYEYAVGSGAVFSDDSQWVGFRIGTHRDEAEKLREANKPVPSKTRLLNLETGEEKEFEGASRFTFSENSKYVVLQMKGKDIIIRNLQTEASLSLGNVSSYAFNKAGDRLAYITDAADKSGNGVVLVEPDTFTFNILASEKATFSQLVWDEEGDALAFLQSFEDEDFEEENNKLVVCRYIYEGLEERVYDPTEDDEFGEGMRITDEYRLVWADDLSAVFFGIKEWTAKEKAGEAEEAEKVEEKAGEEKQAKKKEKDLPPPDMDIWHWKDNNVQPQQKVTYSRDQRFSFLSGWNIDSDRFVQMGREDMRSASLTGDQKHAIARDSKPYEPMLRMSWADIYVVDTRTGAREMILEKFTGSISSSPGGRYLIYFKDNHWWTYDIAEEKHVNLTEEVEADFWNTRYDGPREIKPAWGSGGWLKDDEAVLLYDEYNVWGFEADGGEYRKLTDGDENEIQFRVQRLDREEDFIDLDKPLYLRAYGDKTKKSGYFRIKDSNSEMEELIFEDMNVGRPTKAKEAERFIYTKQTYAQSPNLFLVGEDFENEEQLTDTNPQQQDFLWGRSELVDFVNADGKAMQGALFYPAGYEEGKKYPMLIYIYEIVSNSLHSYVTPSTKSSYNTRNYTSQGYFVFRPDIVYKLNRPGESAADCVVPAVKKVIETGMIDEERIGIMGHSWGAYQTAFIITQTDLFSAAVAGAPLTDMISMYNEIYWNSGTPNQNIFETGQGRFRQPYWEIMDNFLDNSPMFQASNIETPLLVCFGDQDGAVDWHQGIEMYITMRRMQKEMILLVYAGENHSVRKEENRLDYTKKINEYFDHYLKGKEAPTWITEGVSYKERMKKIKK